MSTQQDQTGESRTPADRSLARRLLAALRDGADFRKRKVRRLRAAIRVSRYENALKLQVALERLGDDVANDVGPEEV